MGEQRTGPEELRFLAWQLELHMGTIGGRTTSDKLRTYANIWEAENAALKRALEKRLRQEYMNEDHKLGGIGISFEQFYEDALADTQEPE